MATPPKASFSCLVLDPLSSVSALLFDFYIRSETRIEMVVADRFFLWDPLWMSDDFGAVTFRVAPTPQRGPHAGPVRGQLAGRRQDPKLRRVNERSAKASVHSCLDNHLCFDYKGRRLQWRALRNRPLTASVTHSAQTRTHRFHPKIRLPLIWNITARHGWTRSRKVAAT
jgi:hypothetical protein